MTFAFRSRTDTLLAAILICLISVVVGTVDADESGDDLKRIQGRWKVVSSISNGREVDNDESIGLVFDGSEMFFGQQSNRSNKFSVDETKSPKVLTYEPWRPYLPRDGSLPGRWSFAYSLDDDTLKLCHIIEIVDKQELQIRTAVPKTLSTMKGDGKQLWILKRQQEDSSPGGIKDSSRSQTSPSRQATADESVERPSSPPAERVDKQPRDPQVNVKKSTPESQFLSSLEDFDVPEVDEIKRGKQAGLPKPIWPVTLEAVRKAMAKQLEDMTLEEDRRLDAGRPESHMLRYRHGTNGLDVTLQRYNTPREAGEALRVVDRFVSVKTFSTKPGDEFRLKGIGDEAYRYFPNGSVIMCYSNVFVMVKGQPSDLMTKAARVIADAWENVAIRRVFHSQVKEVIGKIDPAKRSLLTLFDEFVVSPELEKLAVKRSSFAEAIKQVNVLSEKEKTTLILHGTLRDLEREEDCWIVNFQTLFSSGLTGYLDVKTEKLVFLWITPEG